MKIFFRRIHLYLGLSAGLVILTACLTGAILVFEKDLQMAMNKERYFVDAGARRLPLDHMVQRVKDSFATARINSIKIYESATRSAEVNVSFPSKDKKPREGRKKELTKAASQRQPGSTIFIDPYTGQILKKYSYQETGFYTVFKLHRWLLGTEGSVGKYIVGISTLIFLFILLTGIILWWPKTKRILAQRVKIKWNAGWKRINHDMHLVFGFYSAIFLFIIAFTGLAWSFEWFNNGIYKLTGSPMKPAQAPRTVFVANAKSISFENAFVAAKAMAPHAAFYNITMPKDSTEAFTITTLRRNAIHENATDAIYLDQYSGKFLGRLDFANRSVGAKLRATFKPVHTGSIGGVPTKILAFVVCLLGVTFPITGTVMWINRCKRKKALRSGLMKH